MVLIAVKFWRVVEPVWRVVARVVRPETLREVSVPRDVRAAAVTTAARVEPVRLAAATEPALPVTEPVIGLVAVRLVKTALVANRFVEVADVPVLLVRVTVASDERPETVNDPSVPTLVRDDAVTPEASVFPVSADAATEPAEPETFTVRLPVP